MLLAPATLALAVVGVLAYLQVAQAPPSASGPFPQQAYVWQRAWTPAVKESVRDHAHAFDRLVVLGAEVAWAGGKPRVSLVEVDFALLKETRRPVGLALRIGCFSGPFAQTGQPVEALANIAAGLVKQARGHAVEPAELQIDFDCPESKLDGYALWIRAIRQAVAPTSVSITALPSWLDQGGFKRLLTEAPRYVLQVHSLNRPSSADRLPPLCDVEAARGAVGKAARLGGAFLVALPTYGYQVAFDEHGKYLGISAEGPSPRWPACATSRTLQADADKLSQLVAQWTADRPAAMRGVIWYRLPNADDRLNWPWPTLAAVMAGTRPRPNLQTELTRGDAGLVDVAVMNTGSGAFRGTMAVTVTCEDGKFLAADALAGFEYSLADRKVEFRGRAGLGMLPPGGRMQIGWVRLSQDREVKAHVATTGD
jgi:hypothetical protein